MAYDSNLGSGASDSDSDSMDGPFGCGWVQMMYRVFYEESPPTTIKPKQLVVISYDAPCVAITSTWSKPIVNVLKYCKEFSQTIFFYWKMSPVANEIIPFLEGIFPFYKYTNPLFMTFFKVPGLHSNIMKQPTLY